MALTSGPPGTGVGSNRTTSTGARVAAESNSRMRVESCPPTEKKCGSSGSVTAVAWTTAEDAGGGDGESDGDRDGVDEGGELDEEGDGDPGGTEGVGSRAAGRQALAVSVSAATMLKNAAPRRMVRL